MHFLNTSPPVCEFIRVFAKASKKGLWDTIKRSPPKDDIEAIVRATSLGLSSGVMFETCCKGALMFISEQKISAVRFVRS